MEFQVGKVKQRPPPTPPLGVLRAPSTVQRQKASQQLKESLRLLDIPKVKVARRHAGSAPPRMIRHPPQLGLEHAVTSQFLPCQRVGAVRQQTVHRNRRQSLGRWRNRVQPESRKPKPNPRQTRLEQQFRKEEASLMVTPQVRQQTTPLLNLQQKELLSGM